MQKSEQINELATALAIAQGSFPTVKKDANNPFFKSKYADLAALIEAVQEPLAKNGLSVLQFLTVNVEAKVVHVETFLLHKSGQYISDIFSLPVLDWKPQGLGSVSTYCRRYALQAFLNLGAADDDGEAAQARDKRSDTNEFAPRPKIDPKTKPTMDQVFGKAPAPKLLDAKQRQMFWADCKKITDSEEMIRAAIEEATGKSTTKDLCVHETGKILEALREMERQASGRPDPFDQEVAP